MTVVGAELAKYEKNIKFQIYTIDSNYPVIIFDNRKLAKLVFYYVQEVRYE